MAADWGKVRRRHEHDHGAGNDGADIGNPSQYGRGKAEPEGIGNADHFQATSQTDGVEQGEQEQALEITLEADIQAGEQEESLFKKSIGHAADDEFFQPGGIIQHEVGKVRDEQDAGEPLHSDQRDGDKVSGGGIGGNLADLLTDLGTEAETLEHGDHFFEGGGGLIDEILAGDEVIIEGGVPGSGGGRQEEGAFDDEEGRSILAGGTRRVWRPPHGSARAGRET